MPGILDDLLDNAPKKTSGLLDDLLGDSPQWERPKPLGAPDNYMENVTPKGSSFLDEMKDYHEIAPVAKEPNWIQKLAMREKINQALPFSDQMKIRAKQAGTAYAGYMAAPAKLATGIAGSAAGLPSTVMPAKTAKKYLKGLEETTGLSPDQNAVENMVQEKLGGNPDTQAFLDAGGLTGDLAAMALTMGAGEGFAAMESMPTLAKIVPKVIHPLGQAMFAAPALGAIEKLGTDKNATVWDKLKGVGMVALTTKAMGRMPTSRAIEGIAGTVSPRAAQLAALPLSGAEGAILQGLNNAAVKYSVDPDYDWKEGIWTGAALGAGMRLGMGHLGTGGVEVAPKQDIYKVLERMSSPDATRAQMEFRAPQAGTAPEAGVRVQAPDRGTVRYGSSLDPAVSAELAQNPVMAGEFKPNVPPTGTKVTLDTAPYPTARGSVEAPGPRLEQGFLDTRAEAIKPMLEGSIRKLQELEAIKNPSRQVLRNIEVLRQSVEALSDPSYMRNREVDFGAEPIPEHQRPSRIRMDVGPEGATVVRPYDQGNRLIQGSGMGEPVAPDYRTPSPYEVPRNSLEVQSSQGQPIDQIRNPYVAEGTMFGDNPSWTFDPANAPHTTDRAVMRGRSADLADSMGFTEGIVNGPYAQIPMEARNLAGRIFELQGQVHQAPENTEFRSNLEAAVQQANSNPDVLKALAVLQNAKAEHRAAAAEALPFKDLAPDQLESWESRDPYYLPRKVVFNEAKGTMPEFLKAGVLNPDAFQARKIKWLINEATGEKVLVNIDNPNEAAPAGHKFVDATRLEIQNGGNITYLDDPLTALGRSTAQLRKVKRVGEIKKFADEQAALGNDKPAKIFEDAFGGKAQKDPSAMDNFNRTITNVGFLNPFVHTPNQFSHFVKQLGIKDVLGNGDNAGELVKAMHEMANYSPEFREFLKNGGQAMRRSSYWKDIRGKMDEVLQAPEVQQELAREFGGNQTRLNQFIQETTSMPTWLLDDAMRFVLAKKATKKAGGDWQKGIADVDKSFPDYRLDTYFTEGSGKIDKAIDKVYRGVFKSSESTNPMVRAVAPLFMKYRFGQWKSFMNMWTDSVKAVAHGDPAAIAASADKIGAVMFTKMVLLPAASAIYNATFGDEERGLKVKARAGGHQHAMEQLGDLAEGAQASLEEGSINPFAQQAWHSANQFAIMNPFMRLGAAALGGDIYNRKGVPASEVPKNIISNLPFGREFSAMTDQGKGAGQAFTGALLGKVDRTDLEKYISTTKGYKAYEASPARREELKLRTDLQNALFDKDMEKAQRLAEALPQTDIDKAEKWVQSTPEQRTFQRLKSLTPQELIGAYGAAQTGDEKNLVHAAIALKVAEGRLNMSNMLELKKWQAKRGIQPPDAWLKTRGWLTGEADDEGNPNG